MFGPLTNHVDKWKWGLWLLFSKIRGEGSWILMPKIFQRCLFMAPFPNWYILTHWIIFVPRKLLRLISKYFSICVVQFLVHWDYFRFLFGWKGSVIYQNDISIKLFSPQSTINYRKFSNWNSFSFNKWHNY